MSKYKFKRHLTHVTKNALEFSVIFNGKRGPEAKKGEFLA